MKRWEKVILIEAIIFQSIEMCYWTDAVPAINEPFYGDAILERRENFIPLIGACFDFFARFQKLVSSTQNANSTTRETSCTLFSPTDASATKQQLHADRAKKTCSMSTIYRRMEAELAVGVAGMRGRHGQEEEHVLCKLRSRVSIFWNQQVVAFFDSKNVDKRLEFRKKKNSERLKI